MPTTPIKIPAAYVTGQALFYADAANNAVAVSQTSPLPVAIKRSAATPLAGSTSSPQVVGPFAPVDTRSVMLTLSGTWSGSVQVLRSVDGGITKIPVTMGGAPWALFSTNCCEAIWEESEAAATLYLNISLTSGTLTYRLAQ
jgi:hypothetical protein